MEAPGREEREAMKLEDLVPSREMCRPIAHLFPESLFVWAVPCGEDDEWEVLKRYGVEEFAEPPISAPTVGEMVRISAAREGAVVKQTNGLFAITMGGFQKVFVTDEFDGPEDAWASLLAWQIDQGLLPGKDGGK